MLKVGTAEIDITPQPNVPMAGYAARKSGSKGVHDPLMARAIVLDDGDTRVGWIIAELIGLRAPVTSRIRALGAETAGIAPERIMVSATHTHGGPDTRPRPEVDADRAAHEAYLEELPHKLGRCLAAAAAALEPAKAYFGRAVTTDVQHNRRFHMKDGRVLMDWESPDPAEVAWQPPVDPALQVLVFKAKRSVRAVLVQFACHATVMDSGNYLITADWPGVACRHLQRLLKPKAAGGPAPWTAFAQGCCGDINPRYPKDTYEEVESKGRLVARAARRAVKRAEPVKGDSVRSVIVPLKLPRKNPGFDPTPTGEFYECEVQAFRIGDVAVVGLPGEVFSGIGLDVKAHSEFRGTFAGGYTNDYGLGYVPVSPEYAGGGYEIESSKVAIGGDRLLTKAALQALLLVEPGR